MTSFRCSRSKLGTSGVDMGSFSIWHWLVALLFGLLVGWPMWRIVGRLGRNPALSLLLWVPVLNLLTIWYLAFARDPRE